jgi:radical SAM protein with 4Fe4S-binding SPASM domain
MTESAVDPTFHLMRTKYEEDSEAYKEYRRKWNENPKKYIVGVFPIHLDMESSTRCNLRCFMCFQSYDRPKAAYLDMNVFKRCIDEGVNNGLCSVKLQYRGEPLLDTRTVEMVKYAKDRGVIELMFNTNATLLDEKRARGLVEAGLDKMICSVDGCTREVYENVRIGGSFEAVLKNIRNMQWVKKEMGSKKPIVRVQMVDTPRNHHQIDQYLNFWSEIVDQVAIEDMLDWKAEEEDNTPLEDFACAQLWQRLIVLADGDVLPCCRAIRGGNEKLEVLGNVKEDSLSRIWQSDKLNGLRAMHRSGESHKIKMCRLCGLRKSLIEKRKNIRSSA